MTDEKKPPPLIEAPKFQSVHKVLGKGENRLLAQASAVGLTFVVAIILGMGLGWWLDREFGTAPICLLAGLFLGIGAGFKNLFAMAANLEKLEKDRPKPFKWQDPRALRKAQKEKLAKDSKQNNENL